MKRFKTSTYLCLIFIVSTFNNECFGQKNWADQTFVLSSKQIKRRWKSLSLDGRKFEYCFINKQYIDTNEDGTHNFDGTVLLNVEKNKTDSLTAKKMCSIISDKIKLKKFMVLRTYQAYRIFISSTGPKNDEERKYLTDNYFGYYIKPSHY